MAKAWSVSRGEMDLFDLGPLDWEWSARARWDRAELQISKMGWKTLVYMMATMGDSLAAGKNIWEHTKVGLDIRLTEDLRGPNFLARDISRGI